MSRTQTPTAAPAVNRNPSVLPYHLLAEALRLYGSGLKAESIGAQLGIAAGTAQGLLKLGGAVTPRTARSLRLVYRCRAAGLGITHTARKTGLCVKSVQLALQRMGLGTKACRWCKARKSNTDRGSCFECHYGQNKRIQARMRKRKVQELPDVDPEQAALARKPCPHAPGSLERMQTYALRAACKLPLFNRKDADHFACPPPVPLALPEAHNGFRDDDDD